MEIENTTVAQTKISEVDFDAQCKELEALGFHKKKQNMKLLQKTKGNFEVVKNFLEAKNRLFLESRSQAKIWKQQKKIDKANNNISKEERIKRKSERKLLKQQRRQSKFDEEENISENKMEEDAEFSKKKHCPCKLPREDRLKLKEERFKLKEEKKQKREEKRTIKSLRKLEIRADEEFPNQITNVYLDGNNMLFVLAALRSRAIKRKMPEAEIILGDMAKAWLSASPSLMKLTLIFDETDLAVEQEKMVICSARPTFATSDHALIDWAQKASPEEAASIGVFTSDRGLNAELKKCGIHVFSSKMWFKLAAKALAVESADADNLDAWADAWIAKNISH